MSEKVLLTKEQAHEFESFKVLRNSLEDWARDKQDSNAVHSIIHELTFDQMARAYLVGYEIKPEQPKFKAGDKVIQPEHLDEILTIEKKRDEGGWLYTSGGYDFEENIRLATPEEIYWLETLGREKVGDFQIGDIFIESDGDARTISDVGNFSITLEHAAEMYRLDNLVGIYPAESYKPFPGTD